MAELCQSIRLPFSYISIVLIVEMAEPHPVNITHHSLLANLIAADMCKYQELTAEYLQLSFTCMIVCHNIQNYLVLTF